MQYEINIEVIAGSLEIIWRLAEEHDTFSWWIDVRSATNAMTSLLSAANLNTPDKNLEAYAETLQALSTLWFVAHERSSMAIDTPYASLKVTSEEAA